MNKTKTFKLFKYPRSLCEKDISDEHGAGLGVVIGRQRFLG